MAHTEECRGCSCENRCDFIRCTKEIEKEIRAKAIDEFCKEIVAEYDNDGCPGVSDYEDYKISIRDLFKIAEQLKEGGK